MAKSGLGISVSQGSVISKLPPVASGCQRLSMAAISQLSTVDIS